MRIFPAIDIYEGKAVRLFKGDYSKMTVYSDHPCEIAGEMKKKGAEYIHIVDLEGARYGSTPNFETITEIKNSYKLYCEVGGGIRSMDTIKKYLDAGIDRVILGTAAVEDRSFVEKAVNIYGEKIAVGADIKDGYVAVKGWLEKSSLEAFKFCKIMRDIGIKTIICTDISKDGALMGTNRLLYKELSERFDMQFTASGGITSLDDIVALSSLDLYGAIIGKAYYTGAIDLSAAVKEAKCSQKE